MTPAARYAIDETGRLDPVLDDAPCGFLRFTDDGTVRAANATLLDMLGAPREMVVGHHIEQILTVGARIFYQTHLFPLLRLHGRADEIFMILRGPSGEVAVILNAIRRERDDEPLTDVSLFQVRERRKFEDALLRAKQLAEEARAAAEQERARVEQANDLLAQQALELELSQQQLVEQAEELEVQSEELRLINEALETRGEELERLRRVADEANRAKSAFLAMMSHELRTPLNAIGGYVQLLEMGIHGPVTAAQADALGRVARSQRHLLRLINDVLNLSRIESGRVDYHRETFLIAEMTSAVLPMIEPQLTERRLRCEVDILPGLEAFADREKTQQILLNLLSNAVKFTAPGGRLSVRGSIAEDDSNRIAISVTDTEIGISPHQLEHVFEPFVQVDDSHASRAEGTGLGLAISRDLARGMGGDLRVQSTLGEGSTFTIVLPRVESDAAVHSSPAP